MRSINDFWIDYQKQVLSKEAPPIQVSETRRAFHSGFFVMLLICMRLGDKDVTENQGVFYLEKLRKEMEQFVKEETRNAKPNQKS